MVRENSGQNENNYFTSTFKACNQILSNKPINKACPDCSTLTSLWFTVHNSLTAHWTRCIHGVFAAQPPETRLAEDVFARVHPVRLVQQVQANGTDDSMVKLVQFGFGFENVLKEKQSWFIFSLSSYFLNIH